MRRWRVTLGFLILCFAAAIARAATPDLAVAVAEASALRNAQRHAEAKAAFTRVLTVDPDNAEANYFLGLYACDSGDWRLALACEAKAIAANPNRARYQYGWGAANGVSALKAGIFSKLGYAKKCLAGYRRAAEIEPDNLEYHHALFEYYRQAPGFAGGDMALAYVQAGEIKRLDATLGHLALADLFVDEKKYDRAFHEYQEALRGSPNDYRVLYRLGRLAASTGQRTDEGIAALQRCLAMAAPASAPSHAAAHWRLGILWEMKCRVGDARTEYSLALKEDPNLSGAKQSLDKLVAVSGQK